MTLCSDLKNMTSSGLKYFNDVYVNDSFEKIILDLNQTNVLFFTNDGEWIDVLGFCFHLGIKRTEAYSVYKRAKDLNYIIRTFFVAQNNNDSGERKRVLFAPRQTFAYALWKENRVDAQLNWVSESVMGREIRDLSDYESDHLKNVYHRLTTTRNTTRNKKS